MPDRLKAKYFKFTVQILLPPPGTAGGGTKLFAFNE